MGLCVWALHFIFAHLKNSKYRHKSAFFPCIQSHERSHIMQWKLAYLFTLFLELQQALGLERLGSGIYRLPWPLVLESIYATSFTVNPTIQYKSPCVMYQPNIRATPIWKHKILSWAPSVSTTELGVSSFLWTDLLGDMSFLQDMKNFKRWMTPCLHSHFESPELEQWLYRVICPFQLKHGEGTQWWNWNRARFIDWLLLHFFLVL